jgi:excisionase family DNA binding protein
MKWFSIPELAREIGTSDNTVRRYIKRFPDFFHSKTFGGVDKYQTDTLDTLKFIYEQYKFNGKTREEIRQELHLKYGHTIPIEQPETLDNKVILQDRSNILNTSFPAVISEMTRLADSFERIATALEKQITGTGSQLGIIENQSYQDKEILTDKETASFLGIAERTLRDWRKQGKSPAYIRLGNKIRYRKKDIDAYLDKQTVFRGSV